MLGSNWQDMYSSLLAENDNQNSRPVCENCEISEMVLCIADESPPTPCCAMLRYAEPSKDILRHAEESFGILPTIR